MTPGNDRGRTLFDAQSLEKAMLRFIGCAVLAVVGLGLLLVFGVLGMIF